MAKSISLSDALAVLVSNGLDLEAEGMGEAIRALTVKAFESRATEIFAGNGDNLPGKLDEILSERHGKKSREEVASEWVTQMFALAADMVSDLTGETKKIQGGAVRQVRQFGIDTPNGHLSVMLKSE